MKTAYQKGSNSFNSVLLLRLTLSSQVLSKKEFIKAVQDADIFYYYDEDFEKAASHV